MPQASGIWRHSIGARTCVLSTDDFLIHFSGFLYRTFTAFLCFQHALIDAFLSNSFLPTSSQQISSETPLSTWEYFVGSLFYTKNGSNQPPSKTTHYHNSDKKSKLPLVQVKLLASTNRGQLSSLSTRQTPGLTDTKSGSTKRFFQPHFLLEDWSVVWLFGSWF